MKNVCFSIILFIILAGCAVNSTTGSVTVFNVSDKDASNVMVGDLYYGTVLKGQTITYYFVNERYSAVISAEGFKPVDSSGNTYDGSIDLKFDHTYNLVLQNILIDPYYSFFLSGLDKNGSRDIMR
jgi:hypothetical protein